MKSHMLGFIAVLLWHLVNSSMQDAAVIGVSCLTTTDTKIPVTNLQNYTIQHKPLYPVDAVRFLTIKGITICSSPSSPWAIRAMKFLDAKKTQTITKTSAHRLVKAAPVKKDNHKYDSVINIYF